MAKLTRVTNKLFASNPGFEEVGEFGSLFNSSPTYTTDIATIMSQANWLAGWAQALVGGNAMALQDINGMSKVLSYQIGYMLQEGIAEWDSGTTYYIGSLVNDGTGNIFISQQNDNLNKNLLNNPSWWLQLNNTSQVVDVTPPSALNITNAQCGYTFNIDSSQGAITIGLPGSQIKGAYWHIKDVGGMMAINNATINHGLVNFEGLASNYVLRKNNGEWTVYVDNSGNYWLK